MVLGLESHIQNLSKELEIPLLKKNEEGAYVWPLEKKYHVKIEEKENSILFFSPFTATPKEALDLFFTKTLMANLLGMGTQGGVLGLSANGETLILSKLVVKDLSFNDFKQEFEEFLNTIDLWQDESTHPESPI